MSGRRWGFLALAVASLPPGPLPFAAIQLPPVDSSGGADPIAVVLVALALTLFAADIKLAGGGVLAAIGMVALAAGVLMLIQAGALGGGANPWLAMLLVIGIGILLAFWSRKVAAARRVPTYPGIGSLDGLRGVVRADLGPRGEVFVAGALWDAVSRGSVAIPAGSPIVVVGRRGLVLEVEPAAAPVPGAQEV